MQQTIIGRQVFAMRAWQRWFYILLGFVFAGVGSFLAYVALGKPTEQFLSMYALIPCALGLYFIALALRSRLVIDSTHIEVRGVFREHYAELSDIEGFRNVSTRNGTYWRLQLKQGHGSITIQKWFNCDELSAWFQKLTDLDERDRNALLDEIKQSQDLGSTPDDRLSALNRAKQINIALSALAVAAAIGFFFSEGMVRYLTGAVLVLIPGMVLLLLSSQPLLYSVSKPKRDPRSDLSIAILASGFGLLFGGISAHFVSQAVLLEWAGLVAAVYVFAFFTLTMSGTPRDRGFLLVIIMYGSIYAYGLAAVADTLLDQGPAVTYAATVVGQHESHGRSTTYYLDLGPWGPFERGNSLNVPHRLYTEIRVGEAICLSLHSGYLHVQWYRRVPCTDRFVVGPAQ